MPLQKNKQRSKANLSAAPVTPLSRGGKEDLRKNIILPLDKQNNKGYITTIARTFLQI